MAFVSLTCPSCGGGIQLDDAREFGFCGYCKNKVMLVEKVHVVHSGTVQVEGQASEQSRLEYADHILYEDFEKAEQVYRQVLEINPQSSPAWLGLFWVEACRRNRFLNPFQDRGFLVNGTKAVKYYSEAHKQPLFGYMYACGFWSAVATGRIKKELMFVSEGESARYYLDNAMRYAGGTAEKEKLQTVEKRYYINDKKEIFRAFKQEENKGFNGLYGLFTGKEPEVKVTERPKKRLHGCLVALIAYAIFSIFAQLLLKVFIYIPFILLLLVLVGAGFVIWKRTNWKTQAKAIAIGVLLLIFIAAVGLFLNKTAPKAGPSTSRPVASSSVPEGKAAAVVVSRPKPPVSSAKPPVSSEVVENNPTVFTLEPGNYVIGEDIPAGKYNIDLIQGYMGIVSTDDVSLMVAMSSDKSLAEMGYTQTYKNAILSNGQTLKVGQYS